MINPIYQIDRAIIPVMFRHYVKGRFVAEEKRHINILKRNADCQAWQRGLCLARRHPDVVKVVRMTRISKVRLSKTKPRKTRQSRPGRWLLQDAKARFSELVRRAKRDGPQHVTVHGREEVVVVSTEDFRRLKGKLTGRALVELMRSSPFRDIDIEPRGARLPVRDFTL